MMEIVIKSQNIGFSVTTTRVSGLDERANIFPLSVG
jgi:hypothetical protein